MQEAKMKIMTMGSVSVAPESNSPQLLSDSFEQAALLAKLGGASTFLASLPSGAQGRWIRQQIQQADVLTDYLQEHSHSHNIQDIEFDENKFADPRSQVWKAFCFDSMVMGTPTNRNTLFRVLSTLQTTHTFFDLGHLPKSFEAEWLKQALSDCNILRLTHTSWKQLEELLFPGKSQSPDGLEKLLHRFQIPVIVLTPESTGDTFVLEHGPLTPIRASVEHRLSSRDSVPLFNACFLSAYLWGESAVAAAEFAYEILALDDFSKKNVQEWPLLVQQKINAIKNDSLAHRTAVFRADSSVKIRRQLAQICPESPLYHFRPPSGWMNDPNGPLYYQGEYHLFYQHNPYADRWGNIHWGHAKSRDLIHWHHLPVALAPEDTGYDKDGVFSGCALLLDETPCIVYTGVYPETQCLAFSHDGMTSWEKFRSNPQILNRPRPHLHGFRDPFIWKGDHQWWMVLGSGIEDQGGVVLLYSSQNLYDWTYVGLLCQGTMSQGYNWECPNFFNIGEKWVLLISPMGDDPRTIYAIGDFANQQFHPEQWGLFDYGQNYYAPNTLINQGSRRLVWGWIDQEGLGWRGCLSIPRDLDLDSEGNLLIYPASEIRALRRNHRTIETGSLTSSVSLSVSNKSGIEIFLQIPQPQTGSFVLRVNGSPHEIRVSTTGVEAFGEAMPVVPGDPSHPMELRLFFDLKLIEIYLNKKQCLTVLSPEIPQTLELSSHGENFQFSQFDYWDLSPSSFTHFWESSQYTTVNNLE